MTDSRQNFTVEEANRRLPLVRAIVADIMGLQAQVSERKERLTRIRNLPGARSRNDETLHSEELDFEESQLDVDLAKLQEFVDELESLGVELKDPAVGLVDFPSLLDGREIWLCWKAGEDEIGFWHEHDASFADRQSLLQDSFSHENLSEEKTDPQDPSNGN